MGVGGGIDEDVLEDAALGVEEGAVEAVGLAVADAVGGDAVEEVGGVAAVEEDEIAVGEFDVRGGWGCWGWCSSGAICSGVLGKLW